MLQPVFSSRSRGAGSALAGGLLVQAGLLTALLAGGWIGINAVTSAIAIYFLIGLLVWHQSGPAAFGLANTITVLRAGLIAPVPALILQPAQLDPILGWAVTGFGLAALALDGADGWIARRRGEASGFGARFDMEVDAGFVLFLSALVAATGRAGAWILLAGLMRYLWVAAAWLWPALQAPLPPSLLRKSVCVIVLLLLLLALAPVVPARLAPLPCAVALGLLLASFGRDLVWLMRRPVMAPATLTRIHPGAGVYDGSPRVESE